jgi:hypothetical protein
MLPDPVNHRVLDNTSSNLSELKAVFPTKSTSGVLIPPLDVSAPLPVESRATALVVRNKYNNRNKREALKVAAREDVMRYQRSFMASLSGTEGVARLTLVSFEARIVARDADSSLPLLLVQSIEGEPNCAHPLAIVLCVFKTQDFPF